MTRTNTTLLSDEVLKVDEKAEVGKIGQCVRMALSRQLHRRGVVVAISGGIDSSVSAAACVEALGPGKVLGLLLPEQDSSPGSLAKGKRLAEHLGIEYLVEDITSVLEAIGCYQWRDEAIRALFPDYRPGWRSKIVIAGGMEGRANYQRLVVQSPDGEMHSRRMELQTFLQIVAATNFKQRIRKTKEYFHADRLNYAVIGTPNRLEYDQGFFVKNGDGAADIKPIAHLYKSQVYALARFLELPEDICSTQPSTDTYSLPQGQDEFYFSLPYQQMDLALWAYNHEFPASALAAAIDVTEVQANYIYKDIEAKRASTAYLHWRPILVEPVEGPAVDISAARKGRGKVPQG
jgi:NAD+ synthase